MEQMDAAEQRLAQAAEWRLRLAENEGRGSLEFDLWLGVPANKAAWDQVCNAWDAFDGGHDIPELAAARQAARDDTARAGRRLAPQRLIRTLGRVAAMLLLIGMAAGSAYWWFNQPDDYRTAAGERRVVTLEDGSRLSLDSNSEVTVRYSRHQRSLKLLKGQARFDVAHDRSRPFSVVCGNRKVIATGTAFNIDMAGPRVLVTLIEGRVIVVNAEEDGGAQILSWPQVALRAGQQLAVSPNAASRVTSVSLPQVTAWTAGQLIFTNEPLSSVIDRINRYSDTKIIILDLRLGDMKISGVFNAGDTQGFLNMVTRYLRVRAVSEDAHTIGLQSATSQ